MERQNKSCEYFSNKKCDDFKKFNQLSKIVYKLKNKKIHEDYWSSI